MSSFYLFAEISPKPEHFAKARDAVMSIIKPTREEPGCKRFELYENEAEHRLYLFEEWRDQSDLDAHYEKRYTAEVFSKYEAWLLREPAISKMQKRA
ncbi:MAG: putative quinol monooxygenase [Henriciella sp.]|uniref:putative quinol monooxygenase n=1 Tax=Henriciella sp. TaxID=1968823 RepID=UPI003C777F40